MLFQDTGNKHTLRQAQGRSQRNAQSNTKETAS
jgi:hypothetical protein